MIPSSGGVGTTATFYIGSSPFPIEGEYAVLWCSNAAFNEGTYTILIKGSLPKGSYTASINFKIPEVTYGMYFVQFYQISRDPITLQFMVRPSLLITPSSAKPGTKVNIKGNGFPPNDNGYIIIGSGTSNISISTNEKGSFSTSFTVPDFETGTQTIKATTTRLGTETAVASLEVLPRNTNPPVEPVPTNPTPVNPPPDNNPPVNNIPVPSDGKIKIQKPVIISPRNDSFGWYGKQSVIFKWGAVPVSQNVTYLLEISEAGEKGNYNFNNQNSSSIITAKTGNSSTTIDIPPGTYYWRVKAVDGQGNESDWSYSPYPFKVGSFPITPFIVGGVLLIIILIFIRIINALKRRGENYYY